MIEKYKLRDGDNSSAEVQGTKLHCNDCRDTNRALLQRCEMKSGIEKSYQAACDALCPCPHEMWLLEIVDCTITFNFLSLCSGDIYSEGEVADRAQERQILSAETDPT